MSAGPIREMLLILIADGECVFQQIIRNILETMVSRLLWQKYGVIGLMQRTRRRFDLILSYLLLTDLVGFIPFELFNKKGITTPVVFLTASNSMEDEIKELSLGAKDYIRNPVNWDLLLLRVRKSLDRAAAG